MTTNPRQPDLSRRSQAKTKAITELEAVLDELREIVVLVERKKAWKNEPRITRNAKPVEQVPEGRPEIAHRFIGGL